MQMRQADKDRIYGAIETSLINKCRLDDLDLIDCNVIAAQRKQADAIKKSVGAAIDMIPEIPELIEQIQSETTLAPVSYWRTPAGEAELLRAEFALTETKKH